MINIAESPESAQSIICPQFVTPNLSIRFLVALNDYTPAADSYLLFYSGYSVYINSSGYFCMKVGSNTFTFDTVHGLVDGQTYWLKFDWVYDLGGVSYTIFRSSSSTDEYDSDNITSWSVVSSKTASLALPSYDSNPLYIGGKTTGSTAAGRYYIVDVYSAEKVLSCNFTEQSEIPLFQNLIIDSNNNKISITGNKNFLVQNTNSKTYYMYNDNQG